MSGFGGGGGRHLRVLGFKVLGFGTLQLPLPPAPKPPATNTLSSVTPTLPAMKISLPTTDNHPFVLRSPKPSKPSKTLNTLNPKT